MPKKYITVTSATWSAAINTSTDIWHDFRLDSVTLHFGSAPTTAWVLTISINAKDWVAYDTVIYSVDPSSWSSTDLVFIPDEQLSFEAWDEIVVAYDNDDTETYWLRIATQSL